MSGRKGFTLVELAVVLVIVSILVTFGVTIGTNAVVNASRMTTRSRLATIQSALDNYAKSTGYLPCPASRALVSSSASFGIENRDTVSHTTCTTTTGLVRAPATGATYVFIGAVPVRSLGLPDAYAGDAWGNKFTYAVSAAHVTVGSYAIVDGPITVNTGSFTLTTARSTPLGANQPGPGATYVVISHGKDGKGAWPLNGTSVGQACAASTLDAANCDDSDMTFTDAPFNDGNQASVYFDDYVVWGSNMLDRLPTSKGGPGAGCTGVCQTWCAKCAGPAPAFSTYVVCQRTIVDASNCTALCIYGYPANNVPCP